VRLLLISSSFHGDGGYLDHCASDIRAFLAGIGRVLFVPFALKDWDWYSALARGRFLEMGHALDAIHEVRTPREAIASAEAIFVGGGNTYRLLNTLYRLEILRCLESRVRDGVPFIGASAGANIACPTIKTSNDMAIVYPPCPTALGVIPFQINPHYYDPDPACEARVETRERRIREYHEENEWPVLGLREGERLRLDGSELVLVGKSPARLFQRGSEPREIEPGASLSFLLDPSS